METPERHTYSFSSPPPCKQPPCSRSGHIGRHRKARKPSKARAIEHLKLHLLVAQSVQVLLQASFDYPQLILWLPAWAGLIPALKVFPRAEPQDLTLLYRVHWVRRPPDPHQSAVAFRMHEKPSLRNASFHTQNTRSTANLQKDKIATRRE